MQAQGLSQALHELRSDHNEDFKDLRERIRRLEDGLNQEESDRQHEDTSLEDRIASLEGPACIR